MSTTPESIRKFREALKAHALVKKGDTVLIAFSGGPDSVVLAHLFGKIQKEYRLTLKLVHIDHSLRGKDTSARETAWVKDFARTMDLPVQIYHLSWGAAKDNLQDRARQKRYAKLEAAAHIFKATKIAFGHHADDQVETMLMRFFQGGSLEGLTGIPIKRSLSPWGEGARRAGEGEVTVVRPLLFLTKKDILQYAKDFKLKFLKDPSNAKTDYWRNSLRHKIIPGLEKKFGDLSGELTRTALSLQSDADYLSRITESVYGQQRKRQKGKLIFSRAAFAGLHPAIQVRVLKKALEESGGTRGTTHHLQKILHLIHDGQNGAAYSLPGRRSFRMTRRDFEIRS